MELLRSANVVLRFPLEPCVLVALAYWGAITSLRLPARIAMAVALPLVVAVAVLLAVLYIVKRILMAMWDQ
jgi:hypothetical protein